MELKRQAAPFSRLGIGCLPILPIIIGVHAVLDQINNPAVLNRHTNRMNSVQVWAVVECKALPIGSLRRCQQIGRKWE